MLTSSFVRQLSRIAVPLSVQTLLFTSAGLIDSIMLGQLGEREVGAAGLSERAMFVFLLLVLGAGNSGGVLAAQYWGAGDGRGLRRVLALSTMFTAGLGLLSALLFWSFSERVVALGTEDGEVIRIGGQYLSLVGLSMIAVGILVPLEAALRTVDRAHIPTRYGVVETALNIGLNYTLIFGHFGAPALGAEGAALGTVVARTVRLVLVVVHVRLFEPEVAYSLQDFRESVTRAQLRRFGKLAAPLTINHLLWAGGVFTLSLIYGRLGVAELAVSTVLATLQRFVISIATAVAVASSILVGRAIGAKQPEQAERLAYASGWTSLFLGAALALALFVGKELLFNMFGALDAQTLALARAAILITVVDVVLRSVNMVIIVGALKAGGDVNYCLFVDTFSAWGLAIPLAALGAFHWELGLLGVYALALSEETSKLVLVLLRLRRKGWMKRLIDDSDQELAIATA